MNERLRIIRKDLGLTLDKFGEKIGIQKATLSKIENGTVALTDRNIQSICREFNVNEEWLRTGEGPMYIDMDKEDELMRWVGEVLAHKDDDYQKRVVKMLMGLNPEQWKLLEEMSVKLYELQKEQDK